MIQIYGGAANLLEIDDEYFGILLRLCQEGVNVFNFMFLLYVFRPRKQWPEFYGLGIDHFLNVGGQAGRGGNNGANAAER